MLSAPRIAALALPAAAMLGACSDSDAPCDDVVSAVSIRNAAGDETSTFAADEPVVVSAVVTNIGDGPVTLTQTTCTPVYLEARDADGAHVWTGTCTPNSFCLCVSAATTLNSGGSRTTEAEWDQRLSNGDLAQAGSYTGHALDATECAPMLDDELSFTLVR